jgi:hypothetical protein
MQAPRTRRASKGPGEAMVSVGSDSSPMTRGHGLGGPQGGSKSRRSEKNATDGPSGPVPVVYGSFSWDYEQIEVGRAPVGSVNHW